jgi:hypothetical protein
VGITVGSRGKYLEEKASVNKQHDDDDYDDYDNNHREE